MSRKLLWIALAAWLVIAIASLISGPPLGHDESAFAVSARGGGPVWLYRSTGLIWIAKLGILLGGGDIAMRIASVILGAGIVAAAYLAGLQLSEKAAGWSALVIAGAHPMVLRSSELIGDIPAAACVVAGVALFAGELQRGPRWRVLWIAPLFAAGFYIRYGSGPVIAMAVAAALILWPRRVFSRQVLAAGALLALLLAPHFISSLRETGSLFGILEVSSKMPRRAYVGEGLVTYLTSNPFVFYGGLVAPLLLCGLARLFRPNRIVLMYGAVAVGQLVAIGIQSHAQPRYVFVATALLVVLGVDLIANVAWKPWLARTGVALVGLAILASLIIVVPHNRWLANERAPLLAAARTIDADGTETCKIACVVVPQLEWYTPCEVFMLRNVAAVPQLVAPRIYVVSVPHAIVEVGPIADEQHAHAQPLDTRNDRARVWRISR